jgi:hypothetical protein
MRRSHPTSSPPKISFRMIELSCVKHAFYGILHSASNGSFLEGCPKGPPRDVIRQGLILWPGEFQLVYVPRELHRGGAKLSKASRLSGWFMHLRWTRRRSSRTLPDKDSEGSLLARGSPSRRFWFMKCSKTLLTMIRHLEWPHPPSSWGADQLR